MKFVELKGHDEIGYFLEDLGKLVDKAAARVLNEARNGEHDLVQQAVGRHDALNELLNDLTGKG